MGGELPAIHSQEDFDYLMDTVVQQHSPGVHSVWIGLQKSNGKCTKYLDGSDVDYNFTYYSNKGQCYLPSCDEFSVTPCALRVFAEDDHKKAYFLNTDHIMLQVARAVCIFKNKTMNNPITTASVLGFNVDPLLGEREEEFELDDFFSHFLTNTTETPQELMSRSLSLMKTELAMLTQKVESIESDVREHRRIIERNTVVGGETIASHSQSQVSVSTGQRSFWWLYSICLLIVVGVLVSVFVLLKKNNFLRARHTNSSMRFQNEMNAYEGSTSAIFKPGDN
jgi:hypothetical protein